MGDEMTVSLIVSSVLFVAVAAIIVAELVWIKKMRRKYIYNFHAHEIVFEVAPRSVRLYIDGKLEDENAARICMLHAAVDGVQIKAHYELRGFKPLLDVSADGTSLSLMSISK